MCGGGGDTSIKDTEDKKALAEWAAIEYQSYKDIWEPVEGNLFKEIERNNTTARQSFIENKAGSDVSKAFSDSMDDTRKTLNASGLNPNSGKYLDSIDTVSDEQEKAGLSSLSSANVGLQDKKLSDMSNAIAIGKGQETNASMGLSQIANASTADNINQAQENVNKKLALQDLAGTAAGAAVSYGD